MPRPAVRTLVVACLLALVIVGLAGPATAATCTYDAVTRAVTVSVGDGESVTIARSGAAITLDGAPCDAATVTTTDTIVVTATGIPMQVTIDLSGGQFEPGATAEADTSSEIEFTLDIPAGTPTLRIVGSATADAIVAGAEGVNLNAAEANGDADVLITGSPAIAIDGGDGDDVLSIAGGAGTGNDRLVGDGGANELSGAAGEDRLVGGGGDDTLDGGDGEDTASYRRADAAVAADLGKGTTEGDGIDTLVDIENVDGSKFGDEIHGDGSSNSLDGRAGPDQIFGHSGADFILGGVGDDLLFGQNGNDVLRAGKGRDQLDGGGGKDVCKGGDDPDSFVFCENFPTARVPAGAWFTEPF